jgi:hypothetical protein
MLQSAIPANVVLHVIRSLSAQATRPPINIITSEIVQLTKILVSSSITQIVVLRQI